MLWFLALELHFYDHFYLNVVSRLGALLTFFVACVDLVLKYNVIKSAGLRANATNKPINIRYDSFNLCHSSNFVTETGVYDLILEIDA